MHTKNQKIIILIHHTPSRPTLYTGISYNKMIATIQLSQIN